MQCLLQESDFLLYKIIHFWWTCFMAGKFRQYWRQEIQGGWLKEAGVLGRMLLGVLLGQEILRGPLAGSCLAGRTFLG